MSILLNIKNLNFVREKKHILNNVSLSLPKGDIGCLLGPSGCGKTTLLRCIAGFEPIVDGEIFLNQHCVSNASKTLPPEKRHIGMVFQDYALFPHLTVEQNIGFAAKAPKKQTVAHQLELTELTHVAHHYPHQLSGGQQQRVALARALATQPQLLLLDEPFSSLDTQLRHHLRNQIRELLKAQGITALIVTHDQSEALAMSDKLGVIMSGELLQWGTPYDLYHQPINKKVAHFIGEGKIIPAIVGNQGIYHTAAGDLISSPEHQSLPTGEKIDILLRPDDVVLDNHSKVKGTITYKAFQGATTQYTLKLIDNHTVKCICPSHQDYEIGDQVGLKLDTTHVVAFPN